MNINSYSYKIRSKAIELSAGDVTIKYRYSKIAAALQQHILQLQPGDFLEPERDLAEKYAVSLMTMRQALSVLVKEGTLRRQRGKGTVVVDRLTTGKFAIVASPEMLSFNTSPFYLLTINALVNCLREANPRYRANIILGQAGISDEQGFADTVDLLDPRVVETLRGVISFKPLGKVGETLEARGIPVIRIGRGSDEWAVWYDPVQLIRQGVDHLAGSGCRRPGLIWGCPHHPARPEDEFDKIFARLAGERGMEFRSERVPHIEGYHWTEQAGYDLFTAIWKQSKKPDSLLVTDDMLCRGVLRAILHFGVRIPDDLRLITHANEGVSFPFHLPVTRLEASPLDFARQACELLLLRSRGKLPVQKRVTIPVRLVQGDTTGRTRSESTKEPLVMDLEEAIK